jgi:hypothetical protein
MPRNALRTHRTNEKKGRKTTDQADEIITKISSHRKHSLGSLNADGNAITNCIILRLAFIFYVIERRNECKTY